jgi:hypothetical protein
MKKYKKTDIWFEFLGPTGLCGLCGNTGYINTLGHIKDATGTKCGIKQYCICPNGRVIRKGNIGSKWGYEGSISKNKLLGND